MRTIRRVSVAMNQSKWTALCALTQAYAAEKNVFLITFGTDFEFAQLAGDRTARDKLVAEKYRSVNRLQGRMWKLALKDAYETVDRQWQTLAEAIRRLVARQTSWTDAMRRYAYWLLKSSPRLAQLVSGLAPEPLHFPLTEGEQRPVRNYLRRVIRRKRGQRARTQAARSFTLDANMYRVFEEKNTQYLSVMNLMELPRVIIPLLGCRPIKGNLRIVLDDEQHRVEVHQTVSLRTKCPQTGEPCGLDAGLSEVFTDERGYRYGTTFGKMLARQSEAICDKGRKRNRLHHLAKQAEQQGDPAKAARIRRFNLGRQKMISQRRRMRDELARQVNTALNEVLDTREPAVMVTERLDLRGKTPSKRLSRRVNQWARRTLNERTEFKASAGGSRREQVNPAYTSQTCPQCGFVHRGNRQGDRFQCLHCKHRDDADRVAAHNLKARLGDSHIFLWTPKAQVKAILLARFTARLDQDAGLLPPS